MSATKAPPVALQDRLAAARIAQSGIENESDSPPGLSYARLTLLAGMAVFAATAALRLISIESAFDVFHDEIFYANVSQSVAATQSVSLFGEPFLLHPPLFFLLGGGFLELLGASDASRLDAVFTLRDLAAILGAGSAVLILLICTRIRSLGFGVLAALLFAVDPFIVRFDSRALLEVPAMFFLLSGIAVYLWDSHRSEGLSTRRAVVAGVLFGCAALTRDSFAVLFTLPLLWVALRDQDLLGAVLRDEPLTRTAELKTLGAAAATYAIYPLVAIASGDGSRLVDQKASGFERLVGAQQTTGFNSADTSEGFLDRIAANLDLYAPTYIAIGVGILLAAALIRRGARGERFIGLWAAATYVLLAYQTLFGTIEEQMFYVLVVPALITAVLGAGLLVDGLAGRIRRLVSVAAMVLASAWIGVSASTWIRTHTTADDSVVEALRWFDQNVPEGRTVSLTEGTLQFLIDGYRLRDYSSPAEICRGVPDYVVVSTRLIEEGYEQADRSTLRFLEEHAKPVFQVDGRSAGSLIVFRYAQNGRPLDPAIAQTDRPCGPSGPTRDGSLAET